jgi:uncharacterized Zn finger protein (UPF0148 family)
MDVTVEIHCDKCGSANLSFPAQGAAGEIACNDCGERHGTLEALADELIACARRHSAEALRGELGGSL